MSDLLAPRSEDGDNRGLLEALRDRLAREIDGCESARDISSLSKQLLDVVTKLGGLEPVEKQDRGTVLDELRARRQANTGR